jgi:hypothetical protein
MLDHDGNATVSEKGGWHYAAGPAIELARTPGFLCHLRSNFPTCAGAAALKVRQR